MFLSYILFEYNFISGLMKLRLNIYLFLSIVFFFSLTSTVSATTYYISTNGNDNFGDGSSYNPWQSFAKAIPMLSEGDRLRIYGGIYNEQLIVSRNINGSEGNEIIIESVPGNDVIISYDTNVDQVVRIFGSFITLRNISIYGQSATTSSNQCLMVRPSEYSSNDIQNVVLENLDIYGCSGHGVDIGGVFTGSEILSARDIILSNSRVYESALTNTGGTYSSGWGSGIKVSRDAIDITIRNNEVYDNWGEGIAITRGSNVEVYGNTVYNNFGVNIY